MPLLELLIALARSIVARATRTARPAPHAWNIAKTLAQTSVLWAIFLFALPLWLRAIEKKHLPGASKYLPPACKYLGATVFVLGGALGIWSGMTMAVRGRGTPLPLDAVREMVASGPYALVRNPMAMGSLAQGVAVGLWLRSPLAAAFAVCGVPFWNAFLRPGEEEAIEKKFGEKYRAYKSAVRCWVPRLTRFEPGE